MSDLDVFLYDLYGDNEGWVYAPFQTLDDVPDNFFKEWFFWPAQEFVNFLEDCFVDFLEDCDDDNQYLSPVLYKDDEFTFKQSNFVWADFDKGLPNLGDFPKPTYRIESSPGKEHWYWKLSQPITVKDQLEDYNRRLSRAFGGDKVCWNYNRVLRPPGTLNHKYSPPHRVRVVARNPIDYAWSLFEDLPEVPRVTQQTEETTWQWVDTTHKWQGIRESLQKFVMQSTPPHRAQAMFSIAKSLHEYGWTRDEVISVLSGCAMRWDKWSGRPDRAERLCSLYSSAVGTATVGTEGGGGSVDLSKESNREEDAGTGTDSLALSNTSDILAVEDQEDWILKDLLAEQGFMIMSASPGIGKTTLALNLMLALATKNPWLNWEIARPRKTLFFSLEMNEKGLKKFVGKMVKEYPDQMDEIDSNLRYYNGYSYRLNQEANRQKLLATIDEGGFDGIVFDSLSRISDDLNDKQSIDHIFDFLTEEVLRKRNMFIIIIHHEGKGSSMGDQRNGMEKMYGSVFIPAWVDTALRLQKIGDYDNAGIKLTVSKSRYSEYLTPIDCYRNENLILKIDNGGWVK